MRVTNQQERFNVNLREDQEKIIPRAYKILTDSSYYGFKTNNFAAVLNISQNLFSLFTLSPHMH